jgi:hypothetical protein
MLDFLQELEKVLQCGSLNVDDNGVCLLSFEKHQLEIMFEPDSEFLPNSVVMTSLLCKVKTKDFKSILENNKGIEETLSYLPEEDSLFIHRHLSLDIAEEYLQSSIDSFIEQSIKWRNNYVSNT